LLDQRAARFDSMYLCSTGPCKSITPTIIMRRDIKHFCMRNKGRKRFNNKAIPRVHPRHVSCAVAIPSLHKIEKPTNLTAPLLSFFLRLTQVFDPLTRSLTARFCGNASLLLRKEVRTQLRLPKRLSHYSDRRGATLRPSLRQ